MKKLYKEKKKEEIIIVNKIKAYELYILFKIIIGDHKEITIKDGKIFHRFLNSAKIYAYHYMIDFHFDNGVYDVLLVNKLNIRLQWRESK